VIRRIGRLPWLVVNSTIALPLGCLAALAWANIAPEPYYRFSHTVDFVVNDILLALFFGMGYIMGRNSGPATNVEVATVHKPEVKPLIVDSTVPKEEPPAANGTSSAPPPTEKAPQAAKAENRPPPETSNASASGSKSIPVEEEPTGVYLQIAAIPRQEGELEVEVLHKKNFKAILSEVPEKPGTFRVLVGPIGDGGVNKAREDLQNAGFPGKSAIVRRF